MQTSFDDTPSREVATKPLTEDWQREVRKASRMTPAEMRDRAVECDEHAGQVCDPTAKQIFKDAAREWRDLANQIEHFSKISR